MLVEHPDFGQLMRRARKRKADPPKILGSVWLADDPIGLQINEGCYKVPLKGSKDCLKIDLIIIQIPAQSGSKWDPTISNMVSQEVF